MAYTELSRPAAVPDRIAVAGPVRVLSAISRTGAWWVAVKYSVRRLTPWASTRPITTAPKQRRPTLDSVASPAPLTPSPT